MKRRDIIAGALLLTLTGCGGDFFATPVPPTDEPVIIAASATVAPLATGGDNDENNVPNASQYTPSSLEEAPTPQGTPIPSDTPIPVGISLPTQFMMDDGLIVSAQFTSAPGGNAPLVIMLPDSGGKGDDYARIAPLIAASGFAVLRVDLRGSSETGGVVSLPALTADLNIIVAQGRKLPGVDPARVIVIGAGVGANLGLNTCAALGECRALILLSPTANGGGVDSAAALTAYGARPVLIVVARADEPAARDSLRLNGIAKSSRLILESGAVHGAALLDSSELTGQVVMWLVQNSG